MPRERARDTAGKDDEAGSDPFAIHVVVPREKERPKAFERKRKDQLCRFRTPPRLPRRQAENVSKITRIGYYGVGAKRMDIFQSSARRGIAKVAGALALASLALFHAEALAEEAPLTAAHAETSAEGGSASTSGIVTDETDGHVFLAPAIGEVTVEKAPDLVGGKVYAERSTIAGTAAVVSFSSNRPVSRMPLMTSLGAPIARATLTSGFGALRAQGGSDWRRHAGIDLAAPIGSPVTAAYDGRVSTANWAGGYGLLVVLDHPDGRQTRYAHLSRIAVAPGQQVRRGQVVGLVGSTGRSTGPHLHFELRQDGRPVDPLAVTR